jgi:hypothetical protein
MANDSALEAKAIQTARRLLSPDRRRERLWPTLAAAAALTVSSLAFALAMVVAPPAVTEHTARSAPG